MWPGDGDYGLRHHRLVMLTQSRGFGSVSKSPKTMMRAEPVATIGQGSPTAGPTRTRAAPPRRTTSRALRQSVIERQGREYLSVST